MHPGLWELSVQDSCPAFASFFPAADLALKTLRLPKGDRRLLCRRRYGTTCWAARGGALQKAGTYLSSLAAKVEQEKIAIANEPNLRHLSHREICISTKSENRHSSNAWRAQGTNGDFQRQIVQVCNENSRSNRKRELTKRIFI